MKTNNKCKETDYIWRKIGKIIKLNSKIEDLSASILQIKEEVLNRENRIF